MSRINTECIVEFKKSDEAKQIVYGEVYKPDVEDTDGNWMTHETIEKMAHDFMSNLKNDQIDRNHTGLKDKGTIVESFIVRKGDPDFIEGAWVVGVHVPDKEVWQQIMKGELTGFSIEGTAHLIEDRGDLEHEQAK